MGLHDGVWNEYRGDLFATEVPAVQTLDRLLRRFDRVKLDIDFPLVCVSHTITEGKKTLRITSVSFSTLIAET